MDGEKEKEKEREENRWSTSSRTLTSASSRNLFSFFSVYLLTVLCLAEPGLLFSVLFAAAAAAAVRHVVGRVCAMS